MKPASSDRVAIFQANWSLQVHTLNVASALAARGYGVDLLLYNVPRDFHDVPAPANGCRVLDFSAVEGTQNRLLRKARTLASSAAALPQQLADPVLFRLGVADERFIVPRRVTEGSLARLRAGRYRCFIGVEREGLVWAGAVAERMGVPLAYYSLELYTNDCGLFSGRRHARVKRLERKYHARCSATIVQDEERAAVLFADNAVKPTNPLLVPVSLRGPGRTEKATYLHRKLRLPETTRILLLLGEIHRVRLTDEAVTAAQTLPQGWTLVVHGRRGDADFLRDLAARNTHRRAVFSTDLAPAADLPEIVSSADIGLVLYSSATVNDYLTGRASEKAALCAQCGVPMIAFDYPSFRRVLDTYEAGECIRNLGGLSAAVRRIAGRYEAYRAGARRAYADVYEFSRHFAPVAQWIDGLGA